LVINIKGLAGSDFIFRIIDVKIEHNARIELIIN